jgi:hypothetical protein
MATTSIRWTATKHLIDLLRADAISDVGLLIEPGWPGEQNVRAEMIWVDEITSSIEIPTMGGARMQRDDNFTIVLLVAVRGKASLDATMTRLEELCAYIEDRAAGDTTLTELDGVMSVEVTSTDITTGRSPDGFLGFARCEVRIYSRLI